MLTAVASWSLTPDHRLFHKQNVDEMKMWNGFLSVCLLGEGISSTIQTDLFPGEIKDLAECSSCPCIPTSLVPTEAGPSSLESTTCHGWLRWEALAHQRCAILERPVLRAALKLNQTTLDQED